MNYPDLSIFLRRPRNRQDYKFVVIYPGTLGWHQGVDIGIKALALVNREIPEVEFHIYGDGSQKNALQSIITELGLEERVFLRMPVPFRQIADVMANADLGIVPKRNDPFGGEAFSTKILEFMAVGIPVIVAETKIDRYYFNDSVVQFFKPEDENNLARNMLFLIRNKEQRDRLVKNASEFIKDYSWDKKEREYLQLVDSLNKYFKK